MSNLQSVSSSDDEDEQTLYLIETLLDGGVWFAMPTYFWDGEYATDVCSILNGAEPGSYRIRLVTDPAEIDRIIEDFPL
jgi:hypothetical protein